MTVMTFLRRETRRPLPPVDTDRPTGKVVLTSDSLEPWIILGTSNEGGGWGKSLAIYHVGDLGTVRTVLVDQVTAVQP